MHANFDLLLLARYLTGRDLTFGTSIEWTYNGSLKAKPVEVPYSKLQREKTNPITSTKTWTILPYMIPQLWVVWKINVKQVRIVHSQDEIPWLFQVYQIMSQLNHIQNWQNWVHLVGFMVMPYRTFSVTVFAGNFSRINYLFAIIISTLQVKHRYSFWNWPYTGHWSSSVTSDPRKEKNITYINNKTRYLMSGS